MDICCSKVHCPFFSLCLSSDKSPSTSLICTVWVGHHHQARGWLGSELKSTPLERISGSLKKLLKKRSSFFSACWNIKGRWTQLLTPSHHHRDLQNLIEGGWPITRSSLQRVNFQSQQSLKSIISYVWLFLFIWSNKCSSSIINC